VQHLRKEVQTLKEDEAHLQSVSVDFLPPTRQDEPQQFHLVQSAGELRVRFLFEDGWKPGEFAQEKREIINAINNRWMGLNFFYQMVVNFLFIVSFW